MKALTQKLFDDARLQPASWLSDENDEDYGKPTPLADAGISASPELVEYMRLAEDPKFRQKVAAILEGGCYWGVAPVRLPSTLLFEHTSSEVVAFLMGSSVMATDPDSGAYLVATWSEAMVASFLFNDVAPSDEAPRDFAVESLSITECLEAYADTERRPDDSLDPCRELARLYRRGIWIAQLIQEDDLDPIDDIAVTARDASPIALYEKERGVLGSPQFAAYWLLSHALLGRTRELADALERTSDTTNPAIKDLRRKLRNAAAIDELFAKHRPDWTAEDFAKIRSWGV